MPVKIIPKGSKYGRLTTTGKYEVRNHNAYFECVCECGTIKWIKGKDLSYGSYKSCGCLQKEIAKKPKTHGLSKSRIYKTYHAMKARCTYEKDTRYPKYGGKGITVCDEWLGENGFTNFYNWSIENGYSDELTIDRIDSNGNYEPSNCRWVDYTVQANNTNRNRRITYNGKTQTMAEWSRELNISYAALNGRINASKMPLEYAFRQEKLNNRSRGIEITPKTELNGEKKYKYEWANENGITPETITSRMKRGMSFDDSLRTKKRQKISQSKLEEMFSDYYNGEPEEVICQKYGITSATLCRYRHRYGKPVRSSKFLYANRKSKYGY